METSISIDKETKSWYVEYYRKTGNMRNDLLRNSEVTFQLFANENALLKSLRKAECKCGIWSVLDVGCGSGAGLLNFLRFGFIGENLHGIDLQVERAELARKRLPMCRIVQGDAAKMGYADSSFDLVFESTMFVQITDETLASGIANEMVRVCKPGGYIILSDWRYSKPFNRAYRGLDKARIKRLFQVGRSCVVHAQYRGALVPPLGRLLSKYAACWYFPILSLMPMLSGHVVTVLRKK